MHCVLGVIPYKTGLGWPKTESWCSGNVKNRVFLAWFVVHFDPVPPPPPLHARPNRLGTFCPLFGSAMRFHWRSNDPKRIGGAPGLSFLVSRMLSNRLEYPHFGPFYLNRPRWLQVAGRSNAPNMLYYTCSPCESYSDEANDCLFLTLFGEVMMRPNMGYNGPKWAPARKWL